MIRLFFIHLFTLRQPTFYHGQSFLAADLPPFIFCCQFFSNPDLHTTHPPSYLSYLTNLNLSLAYEPTINPLLTLAKLLSPLD